MNKELQAYYESRFSMMATQGWVDLMEDVAEMMKTTNSLDGVTDEKKLFFKKGELSIITWLETLKKVSESAYEELQNETS